MGSVSVRDYGAIGDGTALDSPAIQRAIDRCGASGGGEVRVPPGTYRCGTVSLRDHVTLRLARGATILGSRDSADYRRDVMPFHHPSQSIQGRGLLYTQGARDVAITGEGTIDGNSREFNFGESRPMNLRFVECDGVTVDGITLRDSGSWTTHFLNSRNVRIHGVTIRSLAAPNNDGINIDGTANVRISDCDIRALDDALCFKSSKRGIVENVVVTNCLLSSDCNGLKFGTETLGGFRNITVSNCAISETAITGITVATVDGAFLEDVQIRGITMSRVMTPIFVRLGRRGYYQQPGQVEPAGDHERPIGRLRNVHLANITGTMAEMPPHPCNRPAPFQHGIVALGLSSQHRIEDLSIRDCHFTLPGGAPPEMADVIPPEHESEYPQYDKWGTMPAYGVYARHIRGLRLQNLVFRNERPDARPPVVCHDVEDVLMEHVG